MTNNFISRYYAHKYAAANGLTDYIVSGNANVGYRIYIPLELLKEVEPHGKDRKD